MGKKKPEAVAVEQSADGGAAAADTVVLAETPAPADVTLPGESAAPAETAADETAQPGEVPAAEAAGPQPQVDSIPLKKALESLLFITDHPLTLAQLCKFVGVPQKQSKRVTDAIDEIKRELDEKQGPVQLVEVADGFQMGTRPTYAPIVKKLYSEKMTMRLSTAAHETLAIIAYKQPLTRAEIEQIRGVEVIAALETLLEKQLIKVVGRRETVGRPLMYGTTPEFLRHFGLRSLEDLPPIDSFVVEGAPLGAQPMSEAAPVETTEGASVEAPDAGQPAEVAAAEAAAPSCVEAQSKEFAAGEEMAAEREAQAEAASEPAPETPETPAEEPAPKKTIWDE